MKHMVKGQPFPILSCTLDAGEAIDCQKGAMLWMTPNMKMNTNMGGLGGAFKRALSGESLFRNRYTAEGGAGEIAFGTNFPGEIIAMEISPNRNIVAQKGAWLASEQGVTQEIFFQKKLGAGLFGGEGFIMQKFVGSGLVFLTVGGSTITYDLQKGEQLVIDTGTLAIAESTVSIDITTVKGIGNALMGGEGLFNTTLTGPGKIWLQTMSISGIAGALQSYLPSKG